MKKIHLNPYIESDIDNAIAELEQYKKEMPVKVSTGVLNTRSDGRDIADTLFHTAQYDGNNDVTTQLIAHGDKISVVANGQAVAFIEFGTGITYGAYSGKIPQDVAGRGHYGNGHGMQTTWVYVGNPGTNGRISENGEFVYTHGNPPAERMLTARNRMIENVANNIRREFGNG